MQVEKKLIKVFVSQMEVKKVHPYTLVWDVMTRSKKDLTNALQKGLLIEHMK